MRLEPDAFAVDRIVAAVSSVFEDGSDGQMMLDLPTTTFATLDEGRRARLAGILRPLAWVDGLITATVIAPEGAVASAWLEHIWAEGALEQLTDSEMKQTASLVTAQFCHIARTLFESSTTYEPYWFGEDGDRLAAAADWAAGFRLGIRLDPEPWRPIIDDDMARELLAGILALEDEQNLARDLSLEPKSEIRRQILDVLPTVTLGLYAFSRLLDSGSDESAGGDEPYVRPTPKTGRNDPCPCGSGKKYKKCCLDQLERDLD